MNYKCIGCKAFYEDKNLKPWDRRKCFICWRDLIKEDENVESLMNIFWINPN